MLDAETYAINGAIFEVHHQLGCGFLEKVYQEALAEEFRLRGIPFEREKEFCVTYKNKVLEQKYIADFICYGKIIVELKAVDKILGIHQAQVINYLNIANMSIGILVNFNVESKVEPIILFPRRTHNV